MRNKNMQFWYFLIHGLLNDKNGVYGNFYSYGKHCGEALEKTLEVAKLNGIQKPDLIETSRLDTLDDFELPEETEKVTSDIYMYSKLNSYELVENDYFFVPPVGVAFGTDESELDTDLIKENFIALNKNDNGVFEFQLVVEKSKLHDTFLKTLNFLPSVDAFWIYIKDHWDNEETELWAGKALNDKEAIVKFLNSNVASTIENGYVDTVVHSFSGETILTLTEHKKIQLHTKSEDVFKNFIGKVVDLGFEQTKDFYDIEFGYHHWHYRPENSLDRKGFKKMLKKNNFENIELKI